MSHSTWDTELIKKRNKKIVEKYTYLYDVKRLRFDDVMKALTWKHFFLEERTIKQILKSQNVNVPRRPLCVPKREGITLSQARNNKLIERFEYLTDVKRMRTDDALEILRTEEFYLMPRTIELIVMKWSYYKPQKEATLFDC